MPIANTTHLVSTRLKSLDPGTINELFGSFDAEQESLDRFKDYFVTNSFFESFMADFPLRIAVGNKGAGKSALLRASQIEDMARHDHICVTLSASDLVALADTLPRDGLKAINHWKAVLRLKQQAEFSLAAFRARRTGI
jgi:predicted AAA+ superfamily ATPase